MARSKSTPKSEHSYTVRSVEPGKLRSHQAIIRESILADFPALSEAGLQEAARLTMTRYLQVMARRRTRRHESASSHERTIKEAWHYVQRNTARGADRSRLKSGWDTRARVPRENTARTADSLQSSSSSYAIVAHLLCADLSSADGAEQMFASHALYPDAKKRPTLDKLRDAQGIAVLLANAILSGDESPEWELVRRAAGVFQATVYDRKRVLSVVEQLRQTAETYSRGAGDPNWDKAPGPTLEEHASSTLALLANIDKRFEKISPEKVMSLLQHKTLGTAGIAARLSISCDAFGVAKRENESESAAVKRVKKLYEKAATEVPTS